MDDMDNWFIAKNSFKHLENVLRWRSCNSDSARKKFTKNNIGILSSNDLNNIQKKINEFQVPTDLSRISGKIYCNKETKSLDEIHKRIVDVVTLIEKKYERNVITSNFHLSLHLSVCLYDFDSLYVFWYFSFEKMNGILESTISEKKLFSDKILKPFSENISLLADGILDLMIVYYNDTYENLKFQKPFETDSLNSIIIPLRINKYCRYQIGSEIFGLTFSLRHQKSLYILAKFASEDDSIDIYPGQIQFFFVHEISTNRINMETHYLAYVLHHILEQFVPVKYKISDRKNAKEYLTVNPINRKYNLR
ncbi:hypothetical protein Glove_323g20 [Diversispora epigaea]|uniref:Uncharacterized protein n=1 Tax=Diversispora epigaea TaxID=1348612 RepID=A0A397HNC3_9GLOM|nr:hypothetical protein Glove_323g20 [Diversispora epigaea]